VLLSRLPIIHHAEVPMRRSSLLMLLLSAAPSVGAAQQFTKSAPIAKPSAPVKLDTTGMFQAVAAHLGDDVFISGQPTERGLREMRARGVTTVVNLRTPEEMTRDVKFDEPALVKQLGMKYVYLPVRGSA
jgi:hypothetical protein